MVRNIRFLLPILAFTLSSCGVGSQVVTFQQVYSGYDGKVSSGVYYFDTRKALDVSWLKSAMPPQQFEAMAGKLALGNYALVAYSSGAAHAANGNVRITRISFSSDGSSEPGLLRVSGDVDVVAKECPAITASSFPFAVAIVPKLNKVRSVSPEAQVRYVSAGCRPAVSGRPHNDYLPPRRS